MALQGKKHSLREEIKNILFLLGASIIGAVGMHTFVYPSNFAPMGIDGIATMLQALTGVNAGVYTVILNLPLFIIAWFVLRKRYVIYTFIFILTVSGMLILLDSISFYQYIAQTDKLLSAIFSGILLGARTGIMLRIGGSAGGADIIACIVQVKRPWGNVERLITAICYCIMGLSFFVYWDVNCILLSIVQLIVFEWVMKAILTPTRNAVEVKIITKHPDEIRQKILYLLKHGATRIRSQGMYTDMENNVIISVINIRQIPELMEIMKDYPDSFVYYSDVKGVRGNFRWNKNDIAK